MPDPKPEKVVETFRAIYARQDAAACHRDLAAVLSLHTADYHVMIDGNFLKKEPAERLTRELYQRARTIKQTTIIESVGSGNTTTDVWTRTFLQAQIIDPKTKSLSIIRRQRSTIDVWRLERGHWRLFRSQIYNERPEPVSSRI